MAFDYPVALDVTGRRCVVVGGTSLATDRTRALLAAGATVVVVAEAVTDEIATLAAAGRLTHVPRSYQAGDLAGAFLAIAATGDAGGNTRIFAEAEANGVLLNAVDDNPHCHFAVPSVLRRGALTVTVSTGGRAPALAKQVRKELDARLGPEYAALSDLVADVRADLQARRRAGDRDVPADFATWARRWEEALAGEVADLVRDGRLAEARALLERALTGEEAVA